MSALRRYIKKTLHSFFPSPGRVQSNLQKGNFQQLTGVAHSELMKKWFDSYDDNPADKTKRGYDPTFTTCSSFLPLFINGNISTKGKKGTLLLKCFQMEYYADAFKKAQPGLAQAKPGDCFYLMKPVPGRGYPDLHCGIIYEVRGATWSVVAGGGGGRNSTNPPHDAVVRSDFNAQPAGLVGVLDIDILMTNWYTPKQVPWDGPDPGPDWD